ncbi:MAG TPA: hypothetical protein VMI33_09220 [Streptosporangiaceae bacterium]|nr:hypothetical protein [Streptosporangiaceae bacterium]
MPARPDEDGDHLLRVIDAVWSKTQQRWHDDMASHFDREHWTPLVTGARAYQRALGECLDLLSAAERETDF